MKNRPQEISLETLEREAKRNSVLNIKESEKIVNVDTGLIVRRELRRVENFL